MWTKNGAPAASDEKPPLEPDARLSSRNIESVDRNLVSIRRIVGLMVVMQVVLVAELAVRIVQA